MGYSARVTETDFHMNAADKEPALQAIKALAGKGTLTDWPSGRRRYSWVDDEDYVNAPTFELAMQAWGWPVETDEAGNVIDINFEDGDNKLGDEDVLWAAIAPFVADGSYIQMIGEDGEIWRWLFTNGAARNVKPLISWEQQQ